jgi:hypothetical protein
VHELLREHWLGWCHDRAGQRQEVGQMTMVLAWMSSPDFLPVLYYLISLFGVAATYIFSIHQGFQGSISFLKKLFPGYDPVFYQRLDCLLVICFGSIIGTIFFAPSSAIQALAAGFGWVGAINLLMNHVEK